MRLLTDNSESILPRHIEKRNAINAAYCGTLRRAIVSGSKIRICFCVASKTLKELLKTIESTHWNQRFFSSEAHSGSTREFHGEEIRYANSRLWLRASGIILTAGIQNEGRMESKLILGRRYPGGRGGYLGHDQVAINIASRRRAIDESLPTTSGRPLRTPCVCETDSFCTNVQPRA